MSTKHHLGKYRLIAELGHGGMADVFLALVEGPAGSGFTKVAVVKRLRANLAEDPEFVTMLIDEARITARLNHPNVVQMLEVGVEGEEYFLAMEYLDGQPLHRLERRAARAKRSVSRDARLTIVADVLAGLHHAHDLTDYDGTSLGIIHRDVTPQNIFITYDGQIKVVDFGIAKAAGRAQETQHGVVKGKVRYMSPEQATGESVDRRADIFAVGILLWEAATGVRFWGELDDFDIVQALVAQNYQPSPRARQPEVPEELDRICRKALAHEACERYATAAEMRADLEMFLGTTSLAARRELVTILSELFAKERSELRAVIEKSGKESRSTTSLSPLVGANSSSGSSASIPAMSRAIKARADDARVVTLDFSPSAPPPPPQRFRLLGRLAVPAAAAAVAASIMALTGLSSRDDSRAPARSPAVVAADIVRFVEAPVRSRYVERSAIPVTAAFAVAPIAAPAAAPVAATSTSTPDAVASPHAHGLAAAAAPATVAPLEPARVLRAAGPGRRLTLDSADPWASGAK